MCVPPDPLVVVLLPGDGTTPALYQIARVSNTFCGYDGDTRFYSCVSFLGVGAAANSLSGTAFAYTTYDPASGLWQPMTVPTSTTLRSIASVPSGVVRLSLNHPMTAYVFDCAGDGNVLPVTPNVVYTGALVPRSSNDQLSGWCGCGGMLMRLYATLPTGILLVAVQVRTCTRSTSRL